MLQIIDRSEFILSVQPHVSVWLKPKMTINIYNLWTFDMGIGFSSNFHRTRTVHCANYQDTVMVLIRSLLWWTWYHPHQDILLTPQPNPGLLVSSKALPSWLTCWLLLVWPKTSWTWTSVQVDRVVKRTTKYHYEWHLYLSFSPDYPTFHCYPLRGRSWTSFPFLLRTSFLSRRR